MPNSKRSLSVCFVAVFCISCLAFGADRPMGVSPGEFELSVRVPDVCPTFSWTAVKGARAWDLVVYELSGDDQSADLSEVVDSTPTLRVRLPGGARSWTPDEGRALASGGRYAWLVRAMGPQRAGPWSEPRLFEVREAPTLGGVEEALGVLRRYLKRKGVEESDLEGTAVQAVSTESTSVDGATRASETSGPQLRNLVLEFSDVAIRADVPAADPMAEPVYAVAATVAAGSDGSAGLYGEVDADSGRVHGVVGRSQSTTDDSAGVSGEATAGSGAVRGVRGRTESSSDGASGVFGKSEGAAGNTTGVEGWNASATDGASGVAGEATATSGAVRGVRGRTESSSDGASGVFGKSEGASGNTTGVEGWNASATAEAAGVAGEATATSGAVRGVRGRTVSTSDGAAGVYGKSEGGSGNTAGVEGLNSSSTDRAAGVRGRSDAMSGKTYGVAGSTDSGTEGAAGVAGEATTGRAVGVRGETSSSDSRSAGVEAVSTSATTPALRVRGASGGRGLALDGSADGLGDVLVNHHGIDLNSATDGSFAISNSGGGGVELRVGTGKVLVEGDVTGGLTLPYDGESAADGQIFRVESTGTGGAGAFINSPVDPTDSQSALFVWNEGESSGIYVNQVGDYKAIDIYSTSTSQPAVQINHSIDGVDALYVSGHAKVTKTFTAGSVTGDSPSGLFNNGLTVFGRTYVWGELDATSVSASIKAFRIDHPLKPETHYLSHSSIESWERLNLYTGLAQLDEAGSAWIDLPTWFEPLNTGFRYQLTAIDESMPGLFISQRIEGSRFAIGGGVSGGQVSWQITGVRQDPYALAHPLEVESEKNPEDVGLYLSPEVYGLPRETAIMAPKGADERSNHLVENHAR